MKVFTSRKCTYNSEFAFFPSQVASTLWCYGYERIACFSTMTELDFYGLSIISGSKLILIKKKNHYKFSHRRDNEKKCPAPFASATAVINNCCTLVSAFLCI